jgi:hypothetical protein
MNALLDAVPRFKPGDPPPVGYTAASEWAGVQSAAGLRQERCSECLRWFFPQELQGVYRMAAVKVVRGRLLERASVPRFVCVHCVWPAGVKRGEVEGVDKIWARTTA